MVYLQCERPDQVSCFNGFPDGMSGAGQINGSIIVVKEKMKINLTGWLAVLRSTSRRVSQPDSRHTTFMNALLLEEAAKIIKEPQVLINAVSRRVRQLTAGSRPMVEVEFRMGLADIALTEIANGKIAIAPKAAA